MAYMIRELVLMIRRPPRATLVPYTALFRSRAAQLLVRRRDLEIVPIRGNVATRLKKLALGEADATLLAAAGLDRLGHPEIRSEEHTTELQSRQYLVCRSLLEKNKLLGGAYL